MRTGRVAPFAIAVALLLAPAVAVPDEPSGVAEGNASFACGLYRTLAKKDGNLFFSPHSVSTALAMTRAGAAGETARQMDAVLGIPRVSASDGFRTLVQSLAAPGTVTEYAEDGTRRNVPAYDLSVANAVWSQKGWAYKDLFRTVVREVYGAELGEIDFADPVAARAAINAWVAGKTKDRIRDIVPEGLPTPATRMVLANAIHFKAAWLEPFPEGLTADGPFHVGPRVALKTVTAKMMKATHRFGYAETPDARLLEMPYRGGDTSMVILLPKEVDGLPAATEHLDASTLSDWLSRVKTTKVALTMPRFTFTTSLDLGETLRAMGMTDAFDPAKADFTGVTDEKPLFIGAVLHKAFVAHDEKGTEAAAATVVMLEKGEAPGGDAQPVPFVADHPFLFLIRHRATGAILFMGRVSDPTAS